MSEVKITIDGVAISAQPGQYIVTAAKEHGIYIPTLCHLDGTKPRGACRICTVLVDGHPMTACTTPVRNGMEIQNNTAELNEKRREIIEILFVEGNHFCPSCERSGNCELQALAYRLGMIVPRFKYQFGYRKPDASHRLIYKDHNRCILCKRCIRALKDDQGRSFFAFKRRGRHVSINIDTSLSHKITPELAQQAMDVCPVGAIIKKEKGFDTPIGQRTYDTKPIGSAIEAHTVKEGL